MTAISNVNTNILVTNLDKNVKVAVGKSIETKSENNSFLSVNDNLNIGIKINTRFPMQVSTAEMVLQSVVSPILGAVATSPLRGFLLDQIVLVYLLVLQLQDLLLLALLL